MLFTTDAASLVQLLLVVDSNSDPIPSITFDDADLAVSYKLQAGAAWVTPVLVAGTLGTYLANSWVELGAGLYQWCPPAAAIVAGTSTAVRVVYAANPALYDTIEPKLPAITQGTGARTVTITVNDGSTVLENAIVRLTEGVNSFRALTNVSGVAVFNLDDATYTVSITKAGYTYAGTTLVVNGTETATYSMTQTAITPPSAPNLSVLTILCLDAAGAVESGVSIDIRIVTVPSGDTNTAYKGSKQTVVSNGSGIASLEAVRGAVYEYKRGTRDVWAEVTIGDAATTDVTSFIGSP